MAYICFLNLRYLTFLSHHNGSSSCAHSTALLNYIGRGIYEASAVESNITAITTQKTLSLNEDNSLAIVISDLVVVDLLASTNTSKVFKNNRYGYLEEIASLGTPNSKQVQPIDLNQDGYDNWMYENSVGGNSVYLNDQSFGCVFKERIDSARIRSTRR